MLEDADFQVQRLKLYCKTVKVADEGGLTYYLLEGLRLPGGCSPAECTGLLCPSARDGYNSRLFFDVRVDSPRVLNWTNGVLILDKTWQVFSWKVETPGLSLAETLVRHMEAFTRER